MNPLLETWRSVGPDHNDRQEPYWTIEQAGCPGRSTEGTHNDPCNITTVGHEMVAGCDEGLSYYHLELSATIIAASPTLVRALLTLDTQGSSPCKGCGHRIGDTPPHFQLCHLDVALTAAGFPDAASRDAARKLIAELP